MARARAPHRRADAADARPARHLARPARVLRPPRSVLRGLATRLPLARRGRRDRQEGARRSRARRSTSCASWPPMRPSSAKPLRQFFESLDDRSRSVVRGPARGRERAAGARQDLGSPRARASPASRRCSTTSTGRRSPCHAFDEVEPHPARGDLRQRVRGVRRRSRREEAAALRRLPRPVPAGPEGQRAGPDRGRPGQGQVGDARARQERRAPRRRRTPRRRPNPGQKDLSKPEITIPPEIKKLLDELPKLPSLPSIDTKKELDEALPPRHHAGRGHQRDPPRLPALTMRRSGGATSIIASPVLVGAVTVLVTIVAVFLAYNANAGLPFVPTYDLNAEIPGGANLVPGNDVRVGGFRVGAVDESEAGDRPQDGRGHREDPHEARQVGGAARQGHEGDRAPALRPRAEVRGADARPERVRRPTPPATPSRWRTRARTPSSTTCSTCSTRTCARTRAPRCTATAMRSPAAASHSTTPSGPSGRSSRAWSPS